MPELAQIFWVDGVRPGRVGTMAAPRGGDDLDADLRAVRGDGVDLVVSLLEPQEAHELGLAWEARLCHRNGLDFLSFPIEDHGVPEAVDEAVELAEQAAGAVVEGRAVVYHCWAGIGRSSLMAGATLVVLGMAPEDAWERIAEARGYPVPDTPEQQAWLQAMARQRRGS